MPYVLNNIVNLAYLEKSVIEIFYKNLQFIFYNDTSILRRTICIKHLLLFRLFELLSNKRKK